MFAYTMLDLCSLLGYLLVAQRLLKNLVFSKAQKGLKKHMKIHIYTCNCNVTMWANGVFLQARRL